MSKLIISHKKSHIVSFTCVIWCLMYYSSEIMVIWQQKQQNKIKGQVPSLCFVK